MKKTRIFLGMLGLMCLTAMPVSAADNVRNIANSSVEDLCTDQIEDRMGLQQIRIKNSIFRNSLIFQGLPPIKYQNLMYFPLFLPL